MKLGLLAFSCTIASALAFVPAAQPRRMAALSAEPAAKINEKVDLDSPKVVHTEKIAAGDKCVYCRCRKSDTFPLCNGAHVEHNKATGDNVGPLIVSA